MMRKGFFKKGLAALMAVSLIFCETGVVKAAENSGNSGENYSLISTEQNFEVEHIEPSLGEQFESSGVDLSWEDKYPGFQNMRILSQEEIKDKKLLSGYREDFYNLREGEDCVIGEILVRAEDYDTATEYAKAFGGNLEEISAGIAVISLPERKNNEGSLITVKEAVLAAANSDSNLPAAWPNHYYYLHTEEREDPFLDASHKSYQYYHNIVGSKQAWEAGYLGKGIRVAVLDSGLNPSHEDISGNSIIINETLSDNDGHGHGTHVSGIIAARINGLGGAGIAPEASILSIKVANDQGLVETVDSIKGLEAAISQDVDIINMSLGGVHYNSLYEDKVKQAARQGIAVFCSAGNDSAESESYPAGFEGAIAIAALDKNNHRATFSNIGKHVRYSAPGVEIASSKAGSSDDYGFSSGTSQAAPIASGVAAVLLSSGEIEGQGKERLENLLHVMDTSTISVTGTGLGKGCVSLVKALKLDPLAESPNMPAFSVESGTYNKGKLEVEITAGKDSTIYYTTDGKNITFKNGIISKGAIKYNPGEKVVIEGKNSVTLKAIAVNNKNYLSSKATVAKYILKPVVEQLEIISTTGYHTVAPGKSLVLQAKITPSYVADKKVEWKVEPSASSIIVNNGKVIAKPDALPGEYMITATAKSESGSFTGATDTYKIEVVKSDNPVSAIKINTKKPSVTVSGNASIDITVIKKDKSEGNASDLSWVSSNPEIATATVSENGVLEIIGNKSGKVKITGVAKDGYGKKVSFPVIINQPVEAIHISGSSVIAAGKAISLKAELLPQDAGNNKVIWSIESGSQGVKISKSGKLSVPKNASGSVMVKAEAADGSGTIGLLEVSIISSPVTKITLEEKKVNLFRKTNSFGSVSGMDLDVKLQGGDDKSWTVKSSNEEIVRVIKHKYGIRIEATGNGVGTAIVTVAAEDGSKKKDTCKVTVSNPVTGLQLAPEKGRSYFIAKGSALKLTPVFETAFGPVNSSAKKLLWKSSDSKAVKVDKKGNVKVVNDNFKSAIITAYTTDGSGCSASYEVITSGKTVKIELLNYNTKNNAVPLNGYSQYVVDHYYLIGQSFGSDEYDIKVDKAGLSARIVTVAGKDKYGNPTMVPILYLAGNKTGSYKVTISSRDGSKAKATYKFQVVDVGNPEVMSK